MEARQRIAQTLIRAALRLLAGVLLALAAPALAQEAEGREPACHAYAGSPAGAEALLGGGAGWICADRDWNASARHALLRFELGADGKVPAEYVTRLARLEAVRILIERPDGSALGYQLSPNDFAPRGQMQMATSLAEAGTPARRITVELVGPTVAALVRDSALYDAPLPLLGPQQIWIALLCGLLVVPLIFNLALFRALHDRFLLWHIGVVGFMLVHMVATSGLTPLFLPVPVQTLSMLVTMTFSGGAACAVMLASEFIERDRLTPRLRQMLRLAALWLVLNTGFYATTIDWLQDRGLTAFFGNWAAVILVLILAVGSALIRGSRSAKFLVASWLPLVITGIWQIGEAMIGDHTEPLGLFILQRFAIGAEVLITSIGIADRFIQLRRDHDDHRILASELTRLAERDPLTGLLNRRAIEGRFAALRANGFATLAVLDLDHFKSINDRFGHAAGDDVLRAVAASLPEDADVLPVRMGGEEFLLLLRGKRAAQRAEQVRQAITARVASEVSGLDRPVTASMGLVEIPTAVIPDATFAAIYARADGLLYQAKRAGRNRTVSERMTVFSGHKAQAA